MAKELSELAYRKYIDTVKGAIKTTEMMMKSLDQKKMIAQISYVDWVSWNKGELSIKAIERKYKLDDILK